MDKDYRDGTFFALAAFGFWGLVPIFFKQLASVGPWEILADRVFWSFILLMLWLAVKSQWLEIRAALTDPKQRLLLFCSACVIAANWVIFIWAVNAGRILETSLGYYINPLLNIVLGMVFFQERLRPLQWLAVALAVIGVSYQVIELGHLPWVSLALAFSFGIYGLLRKKTTVSAVAGLSVETLLLSPLALLYLAWLGWRGDWGFSDTDHWLNFLLISTGLVTTLPLLWFTAAARRLPLSTLGFWQYLGPTLSMLIAVWVYEETFGPARQVTFIIIWIALAIFTLDSWRYASQQRRIRRQQLAALSAEG